MRGALGWRLPEATWDTQQACCLGRGAGGTPELRALGELVEHRPPSLPLPQRQGRAFLCRVPDARPVLLAGVRPYKCSLCDKAFTQRCSLESHLKKIHGVQQKYAYKERRAKLYVCEECGCTSESQEGHILHLKEHHPDSPLLRKTSKKVAVALQNTVNSLLQSNHHL